MYVCVFVCRDFIIERARVHYAKRGLDVFAHNHRMQRRPDALIDEEYVCCSFLLGVSPCCAIEACDDHAENNLDENSFVYFFPEHILNRIYRLIAMIVQ